MRRALCLFLLAVSAFAASAQDVLPRVAIIPFNHISVSKADADALTNLFETALVTTEVFQVIEQTQISDILSAQEFSVSDCTDEACAVEFGKLLSAEQIILGTVSSVGGKFILTTKIIDVTTGRNLKADKAQAGSLGDLTDAVEPLAYKMAGLTVQRGTETVVAREFGEIFVETTPSEADILINGVPKGKSPNLFTRVPVGRVLVESRKDNLYASAEVEVTAAMKKVTLALSVVQGNLFITSSDRQVEVFLDGQSLGALGSGLFEKIAVGPHVLELKSNASYSRDEIVVKEGESTRVEAHPRPYGALEYKLPEGVAAEVVSPTYREVIRGSGTLSPLWADTYAVTTSGEDYETVRATVTVEKGSVVSFAPALEHTEAYRAKASAAQEVAKLRSEREQAQKRVKQLEARARIGGGAGKWVALGGTVLAAGFSVGMRIAANGNYQRYLEAGEDDWAAAKRDFQTADALTWAGVGVAAAGAGGTVALFALSPRDPKLLAELAQARTDLAALDARIQALEAPAK